MDDVHLLSQIQYTAQFHDGWNLKLGLHTRGGRHGVIGIGYRKSSGLPTHISCINETSLSDYLLLSVW